MLATSIVWAVAGCIAKTSLHPTPTELGRQELCKTLFKQSADS